MNAIYTIIFVWLNDLHAKFVNNYIPNDVITKISQIETTTESQLEIRSRNQYNEVFMMSYQVINENGHEEAYNIIKKYLNAYSNLHNKNEFCITTLGKDINMLHDENRLQNDYEDKLLKFMQNVAKLYKLKADQESVKYNNIHMYTSNKACNTIQDKFAISQCIFINNCLENDDDFALFNYNSGYFKTRNFNKDSNYVFINLKFDSSIEKQNWLSRYPFESFFDKRDFLIDFKDFYVCRHETRLFIEYFNDETKDYYVDQLNYTDRQFSKITCVIERLGILKHCLTKRNMTIANYENAMKNIISYKYFLRFKKDISFNDSRFNNNLLEIYRKGECIAKNQVFCECYGIFIEFLILRHKKVVNLVEFPMNNNLFEIFIDIFMIKIDNTIIGEISIKYIAHASDIDSFYMPAYMLSKYEEEIIGYETKFNVFLHEVKKYFSQSFSEYDENKRLCLD